MQSRYYDPAVGRFINADGFVSTGQGLIGYNMYVYCNNNPIMMVDKRGNIASLNEILTKLLELQIAISEAKTTIENYANAAAEAVTNVVNMKTHHREVLASAELPNFISASITSTTKLNDEEWRKKASEWGTLRKEGAPLVVSVSRIIFVGDCGVAFGLCRFAFGFL